MDARRAAVRETMGGGAAAAASFPGASSDEIVAQFVEDSLRAGVVPTTRLVQLGYRRFAKAQALPLRNRSTARGNAGAASYWVTAPPLRWSRFETVSEPVMRRTLLGRRVPKTRRGDDFEAPRVPVTRSVTVWRPEEVVSGVHIFRSGTGARRQSPMIDTRVEPSTVLGNVVRILSALAP